MLGITLGFVDRINPAVDEESGQVLSGGKFESSLLIESLWVKFGTEVGPCDGMPDGGGGGWNIAVGSCT